MRFILLVPGFHYFCIWLSHNGHFDCIMTGQILNTKVFWNTFFKLIFLQHFLVTGQCDQIWPFSPLLANFINCLRTVEGLFSMWQNIEHTLANFSCCWASSHWCNVQILSKYSGRYLVTLLLSHIHTHWQAVRPHIFDLTTLQQRRTWQILQK